MWSAKGGAGCSVVAASAAVLESRRQPVLLVDFGGGDLPIILGVEPPAFGVVDWLRSDNPPVDALARMEISVGERLRLLAWGGTSDAVGAANGNDSASEEKIRMLAKLLVDDPRSVVVDLGNINCPDHGPWSQRRQSTHRHPPNELLGLAQRSTLIARLCYLATVAAMMQPRPDDIVIVAEPGRALRPSDIMAALAVDEVSTVRWDPAVARACDAGLLARRLPRSLQRLPLTLSPATSGRAA